MKSRTDEWRAGAEGRRAKRGARGAAFRPRFFRCQPVRALPAPGPDPRLKQLEKENARLQRKLKQAKAIIDVEKKLREILGIPLRTLVDDGND